MPNVVVASSLTTFSHVAGLNSDWDTPANAAEVDANYVTLNPPPIAAYNSDFLRALELVGKPATGDLVTSVRFNIRILSTAIAEGNLTFPAAGAQLMYAGAATTFPSGLPSSVIGSAYETITWTMTPGEIVTATGQPTCVAAMQATTFGFQIMVNGTQIAASTTLPRVDRMWVDWDKTTSRPNGGLVGPPGSGSVVAVRRKIVNFGPRSFPRPSNGPL